MQDLETLRYPIGQFAYGKSFSPDETRQALEAIAELPHKLTALVGKWGDDRLDTPYRPDGWTVRQVVHHVADSHINAYVRTKLTLTEDNPTIKPYEEGEWAKLPDSSLDVAPSLVILSNLHARWVIVLAALTDEQLNRTYYHPGMHQRFPLSEVMNLYAWHGEHHYQHVYRLAKRSGWL
jgi:hypothetical protein